MTDTVDNAEEFLAAVRERLAILAETTPHVRREMDLDLPPTAALARDWEDGQWRRLPMHPNELSAVESAIAGQLPMGMRALLLEEGNGMIGPGYGLRPIEIKTILGASQRLRRRWSIEGPLFPDRTHNYDRLIRKVGDGALVISELKRATVYVVIVSGDARGSVWYDDSANSGIVTPVLVEDDHLVDYSHLDTSKGEEVMKYFEDLARGAKRATFEQWYLVWLDKLIAATKAALARP